MAETPETPTPPPATPEPAAPAAAAPPVDPPAAGAEMTDDDKMAAEWAALSEGGAGGGDQDALAQEWETSAEGGENTVGEAPSRVLDQTEIDSLLGFKGNAKDGDSGGINAIIGSALVNYERLPMLEVVFDRLVRLMTTSLRNFTSDNVEVSLDGINSIRFGDYLNSVPLPAMLGVFHAEEWDNYGLLTVDSSLIYSIVDVLLGGRRGTAAMRIEGRPYTTIERNLVERMVHVVLADMCAAFEPLSPVKFRFERLETNPRFATIARPANAGIVTTFRIDMEDRGGKLELMLPYATLEPVREMLLQMFMGEKFGRDSIWESHLANELWQTDVSLEAVLDEQQMQLKDVIDLKVGQRIVLNAPIGGSIRLRSGSIPLFQGRIGRKGNHIAVKIDDTYRRATEPAE
jgi:flagellar motor switch protein FliM